MDAVLQRPWTEEAEDWARYKRFKKDAREKRHEAARKNVETRTGFLLSSSDGTVEVQPGKSDSIWGVYQNTTTESPKVSVVVLPTSRKKTWYV